MTLSWPLWMRCGWLRRAVQASGQHSWIEPLASHFELQTLTTAPAASGGGNAPVAAAHSHPASTAVQEVPSVAVPPLLNADSGNQAYSPPPGWAHASSSRPRATCSSAGLLPRTAPGEAHMHVDGLHGGADDATPVHRRTGATAVASRSTTNWSPASRTVSSFAKSGVVAWAGAVAEVRAQAAVELQAARDAARVEKEQLRRRLEAEAAALRDAAVEAATRECSQQWAVRLQEAENKAAGAVGSASVQATLERCVAVCVCVLCAHPLPRPHAHRVCVCVWLCMCM